MCVYFWKISDGVFAVVINAFGSGSHMNVFENVICKMEAICSGIKAKNFLMEKMQH